MQTFDLKVPEVALNFIFQLYNFASQMAYENNKFHDPEQRLVSAARKVTACHLPSLTSDTKKRKRGNPGPGSDHHHHQPAPDGAQEHLDIPSVKVDLAAAGYRLNETAIEGHTLMLVSLFLPLQDVLLMAGA